jgi:hypothetical protein
MKKVIMTIAFSAILVMAQQETIPTQPQQASPPQPTEPPPQYQQQQEYPPPQAYPPQQPPQAVTPPQYQQQQVYPPQQYQYPPQQAYPPQYQQTVPPPQLQHIPIQEASSATSAPSNCAQEQEIPGIKFGLRAGLNLSSISLDDYDFSFGWQLGVVADIGSKYFFFHPGIMFIGKGAEFSKSQKSGNINVSTEVTASMYYIEAPLLLSFKPIPAFRIDVGHYVSYGLFGTTESTTTTNANGNTNSSTSKVKSFKDLHDFDFGLSFGVGIEVKQYYVGVNYEFGLIDIGDEEGFNDEVNNQTWSLTLGYNF